jgi:hypothetical protein
MRVLESVLGFLVFFLIGFICLAWPERIQEFVLRFYAAHRTLAKYNPFLWWISTPGYRWQLRFIGFVALFGSLLCLLAAISIEK